MLALLIFFSVFLVVSPVEASVKLNELFTYESSGDWIELYADTETDISGWLIKDLTGDIKSIPPNTKVGTPSASFYTITVSNRLNQAQDLIELYSSDKTTLVDSISYGFDDAICAANQGQSIGRVPDGIGVWTRFVATTPSASNSALINACPTPTPSPSPTPSLTPTPTPNPSPTSTPIPSPTPNPSPPLIPSLKPSPISQPFKDATVAGMSIDLSAFSVQATGSMSENPSPSPISTLPPLNRDRARNVIYIGIGILLISVAGFLYYRQRRL